NVTLDGVVQDPAGDEGFTRGGWVGLINDRPELGKLALDEGLGAGALLLGRGSYEWLTTVTDLEDGAAPRVRLSDGSTGSYDLVVGADGAHSTIRGLVKGGPPVRYARPGSGGFIGGGFREIADWTVMVGRGRAFLTVALGQGLVYCYADVNTGDPDGA